MILQLLKPAARCPKCQSPPAIRIAKWVRDLFLTEQNEQIVHTYRCKCGETYALTARDYIDAA